MLVVGLRRAEAAKRINRSRQAGHGGLQGLQSNYPITPWWTGRITLIYRRHDAQQPPLPSARAQRRSEGGWFVDSCNKVIDLPRGDVSMHAQLALRVELSKVCASFLPVSIDLHAKGRSAFLGKDERSIWFLIFAFNQWIYICNDFLRKYIFEDFAIYRWIIFINSIFVGESSLHLRFLYGSQGVKTITRILVYTCNLWME